MQCQNSFCLVFPAHAGVILKRIYLFKKSERFSRTRGGDPMKNPLLHKIAEVFPAHAGVILFSKTFRMVYMGFSRTRGGDPTLICT